MFGLKYWIFVAILLSYLVNESMELKVKKLFNKKSGAAGSKGPKSEGPKKARLLKPDQIEFAKKWWRNLGQQQKGKNPEQQQQQEEEKPEVQSRAGKPVPSGDMQFFDGLVTSFFPVGDKFGGLPDDIVSMGAYCVQFVIQGIITVIYTTVRWPHKMLLKTMTAIASLTWLPVNGIICSDPIKMYHFIKKAQLINNNNDQLIELHETFKKRLANSIDNFSSMTKIQKHSCCAWFDWKYKSIAAVDPAARDFLTHYFTGLFKLHEIIYCQTFTEEQAKTLCNEFDFLDMEPIRVLPRSWITVVGELFSKFF